MEKVFDSAVHILRDVFQAASRVATQRGVRRDVTITTCTWGGQPVVTGSGQTLKPDAAAQEVDADLVVLPGVSCEKASDIRSYVEGGTSVEVGCRLKERFEAGAKLATACTGAWILAEAGLLDGRQATTTWNLGTAFQSRYPEVDLKLGRMVTYDRGIWCAGAVMAHMDLALSIVTAVHGAEVSHDTAALLLMDNRPSQAHYMVANFLEEKSGDFRKIDRWVRKHIEESFSMSELAAGVGLSERSLARRVKKATGETPSQYVQRLRVNQAIFLLETSSMSFTQITHHLGYSEPASLRRLIRKQTGRSPSSFRL